MFSPLLLGGHAVSLVSMLIILLTISLSIHSDSYQNAVGC